jgi:WD40 repeat protein
VAFSPDGRLLATASTPARIWDSQTGTELLTLSPPEPALSRFCSDVTFSSDGRFLAAAYNDHTARIWDTRTDTELLKLTHEHEVRAVAFSPDGRLLATGDGQRQATGRDGPGTVRVWQLKEA